MSHLVAKHARVATVPRADGRAALPAIKPVTNVKGVSALSRNGRAEAEVARRHANRGVRAPRVGRWGAMRDGVRPPRLLILGPDRNSDIGVRFFLFLRAFPCLGNRAGWRCIVINWAGHPVSVFAFDDYDGSRYLNGSCTAWMARHC